jgi:hypothetical protein
MCVYNINHNSARLYVAKTSARCFNVYTLSDIYQGLCFFIYAIRLLMSC